MGGTFNWKSFDPINNQFNVSIGAGKTFLIDAGLNLQYSLLQNVDLIAGFTLSHFSNGNLKKPNFGINTIAPKFCLKYNLYDEVKFKRQKVAKHYGENEWLVSAFAGAKNIIFDSVNIDIIEKYEGIYYPVAGISTTYNRLVSYKSKIGFGISFSYDASINAQVAVYENEPEPVPGTFMDKLQLSVYPSYELVIDKLSIILQPSFYLYRKKLTTSSPMFYQRIGIKYHLTDNLFIGFNLRAYDFHVSDFIEWNLGYRVKWK